MKLHQHQHAAKLAHVSHINGYDLYDTWADRICPAYEIAEIMHAITLEEFITSCNIKSMSDFDMMLSDFAHYATNTDWMVCND